MKYKDLVASFEIPATIVMLFDNLSRPFYPCVCACISQFYLVFCVCRACLCVASENQALQVIYQ